MKKYFDFSAYEMNSHSNYLNNPRFRPLSDEYILLYRGYYPAIIRIIDIKNKLEITFVSPLTSAISNFTPRKFKSGNIHEK